MQALVRVLVVTGVLLSACTPGTASPSPVAETAVVQPATGVPAETAVQLPATGPAPGLGLAPQGLLRFVDDTGHNDRILAAFTNLPPLAAATQYELWLTDVGGTKRVSAGRFEPDAQGLASLGWSAPGAENLLATYAAAEVTVEPQPDPDAQPAGNVLIHGAVPPQALVHIRHVMVAFEATPGLIGFALGLRRDAETAAVYAGLQSEAVRAADLAAVKSQAEQIVNLIEGSKGRDYGDLDHNGQVEPGGDGFGLLQGGDFAGYLLATDDHARLAAEAPDATDFIRQRAGEVKIAVANARALLEQLRDTELQVAQAGDVAGAQPLVALAVTLSTRALNGVDTNADERIDPIAGEGTVLSAYRQAQLMATIALSLDGSVPPAAATPAGTPAANVVHMENFAFVPQVLTVAPGTTVTWINDDSRAVPHTVTAKEGTLFDSGDLATGTQFPFTFNQPGTYTYYCKIHGDFMSGTIVVGSGAVPTP